MYNRAANNMSNIYDISIFAVVL